MLCQFGITIFISFDFNRVKNDFVIQNKKSKLGFVITFFKYMYNLYLTVDTVGIL